MVTTTTINMTVTLDQEEMGEKQFLELSEPENLREMLEFFLSENLSDHGRMRGIYIEMKLAGAPS